jgi:putative phosphoribosyl transferase
VGARIHIARRVSRPDMTFPDRSAAGRALVAWIEPASDSGAFVFALPRGGIPVGRALADAIGCPLLPALVRKLPIPSDPEMGFGAVAVDGTVRLNEAVVRAVGIGAVQIEATVQGVRAEIERRATVYPGGWPLPDVRDHEVWLVDDGLATGMTMLVAADMLRRRAPARLDIAIPCAPDDSVEAVSAVADSVWCIASQTGRPFAVASFYRDFHDLSDAEVVATLAR